MCSRHFDTKTANKSLWSLFLRIDGKSDKKATVTGLGDQATTGRNENQEVSICCGQVWVGLEREETQTDPWQSV